ncbi:MAG: DNA-binding protein [Bradyrhizobium sp.]|uniref:bifunctional aminoglycoside phosphotransferase/ATP-binding protein n=1 Tax=Bradyrhizobium sp. TaxID=376 RepID=UPI0012267EF0|nr:bifunctional aminoglycoside phosphotransferase/ATP-binding protein [Bradyrhizobium sp.]THD71854.1 MAG: DNA-binding protein [Bradyrhizobium sp.]
MTASTSADAAAQDRVFAFLTDPATHPGVQRIDTHAAAVFLEGTRALKIKRAIRFPYLDYSTLAKRKAACDEELRVNRPFAPQIYHRVVAITQNPDGSLSIGGSGTPVEFAVEMTRFDERQTIDRLAEAGEPDRELVDAIADAIAASHAVAQPAPAERWIESISAFIDDNTAALRTAACFPASDVDDLDGASRSALCRIRKLLEQRGRQGYVRRCHGDLHLANIALIDRRPVLFDAIEFDASIASVDVFYDLAFPIMDFLRYGRGAAANALLNRYLVSTASETLDALSALPLFMSLRSAIRAKVLLARMGVNSRDKAGVLRSASAYFELAREAIHPPAPTLVAIGGLSGTGKSMLARALAPSVLPQPGAVVLRSDVLRKQLFKINETDRLPERAYRPEITAQIYQIMVQRARRALSQGHSVVVDAVFAEQADRNAISQTARQLKVRFNGFFLRADLATRQSRVVRRKRDASDATPEIAGLQEQYDIGAVDWDIIDASGTPEQTLERCQARITHREAA